MAKKKRVKKSAVKKSKITLLGRVKPKFVLVVKNLVLFTGLSLFSYLFYRVLQNDLLNKLFFIMSTIFGFVAIGFLITLLILIIMNLLRKK